MAAGLVVVFGYSDDGVIFRGAIRDHLGCFDGRTVHLTRTGLLKNRCRNECCPNFADQSKIAGVVTLEALWCTEPEYSWTYKTSIPHETFEVLEDGDKYCQGLVFDIGHL